MIALSKQTPARAALVEHDNEQERVARLRGLLGAADGRLQAFPDAIRDVVARKHDRYVRPLYAQHWPEALEGSTHKKLRFLSCQLYATAPYTVLFSSQRPPRAVRAMRSLGAALRLDSAAMARLGARAVRVASWFLDERIEKRIVQISAFIATIDHVMDKCMDGVEPAERARRMRGALSGAWVPEATVPQRGAFLFLRALQEEIRSEIDDDGDRAAFHIAMARVDDFVDSEVKAMSGVADPSGCSWRTAGVLGTIDGLIFPVQRFAGDVARQWMYDVSLFVQVMDDYIDLDKDRLDVRETPCLTGVWTFDTVEQSWTRTLDGIVALAESSGVTDPSYLAFVRDTYRIMTIEVMEAMVRGSAA